MSRTVTSPLQKKLAALIVEYRKKAGLRQVDLAERLGQYQSWVTHLESGQRRIDLIELIEVFDAMGFEPGREITKVVRDLLLVSNSYKK